MGAYAAYEPDAPRRQRVAVDVRAATPADAPSIAALYAERHAKPLDEVEPQVCGELEKLARGELAGAVFVALVGGDVVGYGRVRRVVPGVDGQPDELPAGWYLMGVIVAPVWRRQGIAAALGRQRLAWIGERAGEAYCFSNRRNRAALDLHASLGFEPVDLAFAHERAGLEWGEGRLLRCRFRPESR